MKNLEYPICAIRQDVSLLTWLEMKTLNLQKKPRDYHTKQELVRIGSKIVFSLL